VKSFWDQGWSTLSLSQPGDKLNNIDTGTSGHALVVLKGLAHKLQDAIVENERHDDQNAYCHTCELYGHRTCWPDDVEDRGED